ncbi:MAG TPA: hypothetical protein VEF34_08005 [Syntrophobacteraceae bacterium]|nr:hypothetical protein [Syntrophobacteraceae bacterium]
MRKFALLAAVVCLVSCYAVNANAGNPSWTSGAVASDHYVGFTTATTNGNAHGEVGMNNLCQAKFGPTAHICTAGEYFSTASATGPIQEKWLQPSVSNCVSSSTSPYVMCQVPTISDGTFIDPTDWVHSCQGWTSVLHTDYGAAAEAGTDTYAHLSNTTTCDTKLPVACCAP